MTSPTPRPRTWAFLAPTLDRPSGGDIAMFELAGAVARAGHDVVLVHVPFLGSGVQRLSDVAWFDFEPTLRHAFAPGLDPDALPAADVVVYSTKLLATAMSLAAGPAGRQLVAALRDPAARGWLPVLFLQGYGVFVPEVEELARRLPGPKVCVGAWLAERLVVDGAPAADVVHIPNGVDHATFRVIRPIATRSPLATMHFDPHPVKGGAAGLAALEALHRAEGVPSLAFGTRAPEAAPGPGVGFEVSPSRPRIAAICNEATLFLQPSQREGFGMCAVDAMASGCALVTTANGGSADYAIDGETAVVCGPTADEMAEALARLVTDDDRRVALAEAGTRFVHRFRWSTSAERLIDLAHRAGTPSP